MMAGPPNTRMQRTRSSPSALRSPLMRCPLGSAKGLLLLVALVVAHGCASVSEKSELTIGLVDAAGGHALPAIDVILTEKTTGKVYQATTTATGQASFTGVAEGQYLLSVRNLVNRDHLNPDHVVVTSGAVHVVVKVNLSTDGPIYVGPGAA